MKDAIQSAIMMNSETMRRKWMRWPRTAVRVVMFCFKMEGIETRIVAREVDTAIPQRMHSNRSINEGGKDRGLSLGDGRVEAGN